LTFGSRGDVQPFVALAAELRRAGHDVFLCAPSNFAPLAADYGVPFRPQAVDSRELVARPEVREAMESGSPLKFLRIKGLADSIADSINLDAWNATRDVDAMFFKAEWPAAGYSIARKRKILGIEVNFAPTEPSWEIPGIGMGVGRHRRLVNRATSELSCRVFWSFFLGSANRFRRGVLDMPRLPRTGPFREYARTRQPVFYAFSPTLLPKPSDWRPDAHVLGYFFLSEPGVWQPGDELCRFVESGPRPIYVGFGSMPSPRARETMQAILTALTLNGQRAVLQEGWGGLGGGIDLPADVHLAKDVPHSWLFPRMAAVIHHGGSGTTGAVLRAGIPSIIMPHNFDQPFWAQRVYELGVSPPPIPLKRLDPERLAATIRACVADSAMRERATAVGQRVRAEHGVERAVELFEGYAARFGR